MQLHSKRYWIEISPHSLRVLSTFDKNRDFSCRKFSSKVISNNIPPSWPPCDVQICRMVCWLHQFPGKLAVSRGYSPHAEYRTRIPTYPSATPGRIFFPIGKSESLAFTIVSLVWNSLIFPLFKRELC